MALFSKKSRKQSKDAESKPAAKQTSKKSNGKANTLSKAQSTPSSRRNSLRNNAAMAQQIAQESGFDPAFARNNDSAYPPIMPVPQIQGADKNGDFVKTNTKAAKLLGLDPRHAQSAPSSRPSSSPVDRHMPSKHGSNGSDTSDDQNTASRHDSFNSSGETPRLGTLSSEKPQMTFAEELALEPAFSDTSSQQYSRPPSEFGHSRQVSRDSFRPAQPRRHSSQHVVSHARMQSHRDAPFNPAELLQRARSQHQVPTFIAANTDAPAPLPRRNPNRMSMYADMDRMGLRHSEIPVVPPFPGAYQPRMSFMTHEPSPVMPSPIMRPQFSNEAPSTPTFRSKTNGIGLPPLSILDGLKVNKRGKLLDEEGDVIGELVEGDLIDCVRQKANSNGEVLDEYGRVVGTVRTVMSGIGISTPALNMSSPAIMSNTSDYFNIQPQMPPGSPAMTPALDARALQQRMQDDMMQKYRMIIDVPPVPVMPAAYQSVYHSPILSAQHMHAVAPLGQSEDAPRVELDASGDIEAMDEIPAFDLSEPFQPTPRSSPASEPVVAKKEMPVVQTVHSRVQVTQTDHIDSTAASITSDSEPSLVEDDDDFVPARERASSPIERETTTRSFGTVQEESIRTQYISVKDSSDEPEDMPTPREQAFPMAIGDAIPQPAPAPIKRATPSSPTATRFFHRPAPARDIQPAQTEVKQKVEEATPQPTPAPLSSHPTASESRTATAIAVEQPVQKTQAPSISGELKSAFTRPSAPRARATAPADIPPLKSSMAPRREPRRRETEPVEAPKIGSNSEGTTQEDSLSEGESIDSTTLQRKKVSISTLPPTTILPRAGLSRTVSDGAALGSRIRAMPSVPESEPLPEVPLKSMLLSPDSANSRPLPARAFSARAAPPLPAFPRQGFTNGLPQSPFAKANAMNNNGAGFQKRNSMPGRPGQMPVNARMAMNKNRYTLNAPLVSSPLSDHHKTLSTMTASSISSVSNAGSDTASERFKPDTISIYSTPARSRTYFTHGGRVTVEEGDPTPAQAAAVKDTAVVTERPVTSDGLKADAKSKKKGRFSMSFGKKQSAVVAAH